MSYHFKTLYSFVLLSILSIFPSCLKNEIVGHFKVKGFIINRATAEPEIGHACNVLYTEHILTSTKPAIEAGSGIVDSSGYFEFLVELRAGGGAYRFHPHSIDLNRGLRLTKDTIIDLDTLYL